MDEVVKVFNLCLALYTVYVLEIVCSCRMVGFKEFRLYTVVLKIVFGAFSFFFSQVIFTGFTSKEFQNLKDSGLFSEKSFSTRCYVNAEVGGEILLHTVKDIENCVVGFLNW